MRKPSRFLRALLSCAVVAAQGPAIAKMSFVPPGHMVDNWKAYAGVQAVGRIRKIEPYADYESIAPCTIDKNWCDLVRPKLQIATVQVARSGQKEVEWIMTIPTEQHLKIGEYLVFSFPANAKEIADGVIEDDGRLRTMKCNWGTVENGSGYEGVVCEKWNYAQINVKGALDDKGRADKAPAAAASAPSAAASQ